MTAEVKEKAPILSVQDLEVTFGRGKKAFKAVRGVSFDVFEGETFGVVGESGSGKTTIGRAIMRIHPASGGQILYHGERIDGKLPRGRDRQLTREIQMIFQDPMSSLNERAKVEYIVSEGLYNLPMTEAERHNKVAEALAGVGLLPEFASRFPHEFSGGQRQRIGIARALIMQPRFVIADEPISALDVSIRAQVLNLLSHLQKEMGLTCIFISHDLSVMRFICDRICVLYQGRVVELATTDLLYKNPLHPYTKALLSAIPLPDPQRERNKQLMVYDPSQHAYDKAPPNFIEIEPDHFVLCNAPELEAYRAALST